MLAGAWGPKLIIIFGFNIRRSGFWMSTSKDQQSRVLSLENEKRRLKELLDQQIIKNEVLVKEQGASRVKQA